MFRFIHTSDLHIGKVFDRFPVEVAALLRNERLAVLERISAYAQREGIAQVMVAGDTYDRETLGSEQLNQPLHIMARAQNVSWWILPGNHDPARAGGVWDRLSRGGFPENVDVLTGQEVVHPLAEATLLAAPVVSKHQRGDPTAWFDDVPRASDVISIGLAHGPVNDFGDDGETMRIARDRTKTSRLDYLALGDWHGALQVNERTHYCGTPEIDSFKPNRTGVFLDVTIPGAGVEPLIKEVRQTGYTWWAATGALVHADDVLQLTEELTARVDAHGRSLIARVRPNGTLAADRVQELARTLERVNAQVAYLQADLTELVSSGSADSDAGTHDLDPALRSVHDRLMALDDLTQMDTKDISALGDVGAGTVVDAAVQLLHTLGAQVGETPGTSGDVATGSTAPERQRRAAGAR